MTNDLLKTGLEHGFIDRTIVANGEFIPQFLTNDPSRGEKVITSIKHEMTHCKEFMFSTAFVTSDGVNALLSEFKYLKEHNIKGRIMASQYQNFTDPNALRKLKSFDNIDVRIVTEEQMKMHSKCYIFMKNDSYDIIIGSSNLTNNALCSNGEWNLKLNSTSAGDVIHNIVNEFNKIFEHATPITDIWIEEYSLIYNDAKQIRRSVAEHDPRLLPSGEYGRISPNRMQAEALQNIQSEREKGNQRALVISATGSGKTYLSAFDAKKFGGKFLYIVHRLPILKKSMESYRKVMEPDVVIEEYSPESNNLTADCLFTTIQTLSKIDVLKKIPADTFDYILIDEVHHAGAETYQRVIDHFNPKFLLDMTATPDRTDGYDIYKLFNNTIAYDIRLKQAMEYNLICPFHYFGIADLDIAGLRYNDKTAFTEIEKEQRVKHIIENAEYYGFCGNRVKGIVFCRTLAEAEYYCTAFCCHGYRAKWVSGQMDKRVVEECIENLEADDSGKQIDYIFTADLFNEGVDIPSVNQVIMLRPTESPIVYIQQLGRGLRLHDEKDFVVILDFIGNYEKNYNIPLALSDDRTYNKSSVRKFIATGDSIIPGNSTISFDEIAKNRIYESVDRSDFTDYKILVEGYISLKNKLGRIPSLCDFKKYGSINALNIISKYGSYHGFLSVREKDYNVSFDEGEIKYLEYVCKIIAPGKRLLEIEMLELINSECTNVHSAIAKRHPEMNENAMENIIAVFDGKFYKNGPVFIESNRICDHYRRILSNPILREQIEDVINLGKENNESEYSEMYENTNLVLYKMYTYDDVCRLMNWKADVTALNIGGYKYDDASNTFSVFINYVKGDDVLESQRYEDHFESKGSLIAISKSTEDSHAKNMVRVKDAQMNGTSIHLFVRKNKNDKGSKEFYYLGLMTFESFMNEEKPVKIRYELKNEVRTDLFDYFNT